MVWDAIVADETRSKIISCVYGKTFPLIDSEVDQRGKIDSKKTFRTPIIVRSVDDLIRKLATLKAYNGSYTRPSPKISRTYVPYIGGMLKRVTPVQLFGIVGVSLFGAGLIAMVLLKNSEKRSSNKK